MRWLGRSLLFVALTLLTAELVLQGAALLVHDRSTVAREGKVTILCVGDSHTFGGGMKPGHAYPGRLSAQLNAVAPGYFRVVNLGIPAFNTTQVRNRLPDQILRYRPAMVLVWVGVLVWALVPLGCKESQTLGLLEYRVLASKSGFSVTYTDENLRPQEMNVNDIVWSINFPILTGSAASLTALGNKLDQEITAEIWYQGVRLASDTDAGDLPFVNVVAPL